MTEETEHEVTNLPQVQSLPRDEPRNLGLERTLGLMNDNMNQITDFLANLSAAQLQASRPSKRKRHMISESDSDSEDGHRPTTQRNDEISDDNISLHAQDDLDVDKDIEMLTERSKATGQKDGENPDNILKQLSSQLDEDEATGGKIKDELAQIAEKRWGKSLAPAKIKGLADKYKCPENCPSIRGTKVNTEIWTQLNSHKRSEDLALSNMQQTIRKIMNANLQVTNLVLESPTGEPNKKIFEPQIESLAMLSHVHNQITQFRREQLKPALLAEYNTICFADIPAKS